MRSVRRGRPSGRSHLATALLYVSQTDAGTTRRSALPSKQLSPRSTAALEVFWDFAAERQAIYHQRIEGLPGPWTSDGVIAQHRFTNAYRASDRVTQFLINDVIYASDVPNSWRDTFARILTFKLFNKIETWNYVTEQLGQIDAQAVIGGHVQEELSKLAGHQTLYNAAYIMPPPQTFTGPKFIRHLALLRQMLIDGLDDQVRDSASLREIYTAFRSYPSIGPFLAYQFTIDLNYTHQVRFDENDFVVPGPGALRGIAKCFSDVSSSQAPDLIRWTTDQQETAFAERPAWQGLWGRPLHLIDVQNLFCEVDKYTRVARPDLCGNVQGSRIKQRYVPDPQPITASFPPKWKLDTTPKPGDHVHTNQQLVLA